MLILTYIQKFIQTLFKLQTKFCQYHFYLEHQMDKQNKILEHQFINNQDATTLLVFLQGWPDSKQLWKQKMGCHEELRQFKHLYINFPNYGKQKISWGQDFKTIAQRTKSTIDTIKGIDKKILICHDWGCVFGYLLDQYYPRYFNHIVALDVPAYTEITGGFKGKAFVMAYQSFLIWCFLIGGSIGGILTRYASKLFKHEPSYYQQINSDRNYPYYYYWKNQLLSRFGTEERLLKGYKPSVPISYFFGKNKPMQFHGQRWVNYLKNSQKCCFQGVNAGHWFMGKYKNLLFKQITRVAKL